MPIRVRRVAPGEIIVERSLSSGNASEIAGRILQRLPRVHNEPGKRTYTMGAGFASVWRGARAVTHLSCSKKARDQTAWRFRQERHGGGRVGGGSLADRSPRQRRGHSRRR